MLLTSFMQYAPASELLGLYHKSLPQKKFAFFKLLYCESPRKKLSTCPRS